MKKITILILISLLTGCGSAQQPFFDKTYTQTDLVEMHLDVVDNNIVIYDTVIDQASIIPIVVDVNDITMLVNKLSQLPDGYHPDDLISVNGSVLGRTEAVRQWRLLEAASVEAGLGMFVIEGYRSQNLQRARHENFCRANSRILCNSNTVMSRRSEHETGLAFNIRTSSGNSLDISSNTEESMWLHQNAHLYGFIVRYPHNKEHITGLPHEPDHVRYVGVMAATQMYRNKQTLEEYHNQVFR